MNLDGLNYLESVSDNEKAKIIFTALVMGPLLRTLQSDPLAQPVHPNRILALVHGDTVPTLSEKQDIAMVCRLFQAANKQFPP